MFGDGNGNGAWFFYEFRWFWDQFRWNCMILKKFHLIFVVWQSMDVVSVSLVKLYVPFFSISTVLNVLIYIIFEFICPCVFISARSQRNQTPI